jgi:hypothetical protein
MLRQLRYLEKPMCFALALGFFLAVTAKSEGVGLTAPICGARISRRQLNLIPEEGRGALKITSDGLVMDANLPVVWSRQALALLKYLDEWSEEMLPEAERALNERILHLARALHEATGRPFIPDETLAESFMGRRPLCCRPLRIVPAVSPKNALIDKYRLSRFLEETRGLREEVAPVDLDKRLQKELRDTLFFAQELGLPQQVNLLISFVLQVGDLEALSLFGQFIENDRIQFEIARWHLAHFFISSHDYSQNDVMGAIAALQRVRRKKLRRQAHQMLADIAAQLMTDKFINFAVRTAEAQGRATAEELFSTFSRRFKRLAIHALTKCGEVRLRRIGLNGALEDVFLLSEDSKRAWVRSRLYALARFFLHSPFDYDDLEAAAAAVEILGDAKFASQFAAMLGSMAHNPRLDRHLGHLELYRATFHVVANEKLLAAEVLDRVGQNSYRDLKREKYSMILTLLARIQARSELERLWTRLSRDESCSDKTLSRATSLLVRLDPQSDLRASFPYQGYSEPLQGLFLQRDRSHVQAAEVNGMEPGDPRARWRRYWLTLKATHLRQALVDFKKKQDSSGLIGEILDLLTMGEKSGEFQNYLKADEETYPIEVSHPGVEAWQLALLFLPPRS